METSTTIIGLVILVVFVGPFLYAALKSSSRKKKLEETLSERSLLLNEQEELNGRVIGLDTNKRVLFYAFFDKNDDLVETVDLSKIAVCRILSNKQDEFSAVGLELEVKNQSGTRKSKLLFSSDKDSVQAMENAKRLSEKWKLKIDGMIASK